MGQYILFGNAFLIFNNIFFLDRKNGPNSLPINPPKFDPSLKPKILNTINKIIIKKNSKKYLIIFIIFLLKNLLILFCL